MHVKEYQIYGGYCLQCKKQHRGELSNGIPSGILCVNALAKIAALTGKYRLSKREVRAFLFDFFGLKISIGSVSNAERIVSESLKKPTEEIGETLIKQSHLHVEETSHYHRGHLEWLWVATNNHAERQLRHGVIWRKKCYGTQSNRGILFIERILTIVKTCIQKGRGLIHFIAQSIQSNWRCSNPPSRIHPLQR